MSEVYRTSTFSAFRTLKLRGLQIKDPPLNSQLYDQVVNHTGMYFCFPLWKGLRSKDRLNFSCFRIIPFWILSNAVLTMSGFSVICCCGFTYFSKICYLEMTTQVWALSFGCFSSIIGFGRVSSHDVFENLSKSVRLHLTRFYRKRTIAGNDKQSWSNIRSIKIY